MEAEWSSSSAEQARLEALARLSGVAGVVSHEPWLRSGGRGGTPFLKIDLKQL